METLSHLLPHVTAALNATATGLLVAALVFIRRGQIRQHRTAMLTCVAVSAVFLAMYLLHKYALFVTTGMPNKTFPRDTAIASDAVRYLYFSILGSHLLLAMLVPPLAIAAVWLGLKNRVAAHRRLVRWAYPIWLYVSITGVIVYLMLYQLYPT